MHTRPVGRAKELLITSIVDFGGTNYRIWKLENIKHPIDPRIIIHMSPIDENDDNSSIAINMHANDTISAVF